MRKFAEGTTVTAGKTKGQLGLWDVPIEVPL